MLTARPLGETIFISDLHLSPKRPEIVELFLHFLAQRLSNVAALYILGDLFDAWIGDDDDSPPYPIIIAALRTVSETGTKLFVQRGNRDFLLGRRFARATGCQLLKDPVSIDLYGKTTLLMHGDLLCSDDVAYQRFRRFARNPLFIRLFLLRSLTARRQQAARYRYQSGAATAVKPLKIMDVNQDTVMQYMRRFKAEQLIHGHIHRPGQHAVFVDGTAAQRWVLAEWQADTTSILRANATGIQFEDIR